MGRPPANEHARWKPGQSGNPRGRAKGHAAVARTILRETDHGDELVMYALKIWRDPDEPKARRDEMHRWLADRGLGRALTMVDLSAEVQTTSVQLVGHVDLAGLPPAALDALEAVLAAAVEGEESPPDPQLPAGDPEVDGSE